MTQAFNGKLYIEKEPPLPCEVCGALKETRPYGPGGIRVCFPCGMKDQEEAKRQFQARMDAVEKEAADGR